MQISTRVAVLLLCLCGAPRLSGATDSETAALEAYALCHAQPYRCPPGAPMTPEERAPGPPVRWPDAPPGPHRQQARAP